jgi:DTW domain-containing protein
MQFTPRLVCDRCGRPQAVCYCAHVPTVATRSRLLFLQHPREENRAIGTARIAALGLTDAQIEVGIDFSEHPGVQAALADPERPALLLYPGKGARDLAQERPTGPVTLVVLDGTWNQARSLFRKNPWLAALPRYAFEPDSPSEYRIRREPREDYVSTVEAVVQALGELEGDRERFVPLLAPFRAMVDTQLGYAARSSGGRHRLRRRGGSRATSRLPALLQEPSLVCVMGEANAGRYVGGGKEAHAQHELVYWTAVRLCDGTRFEALLAPRRELTTSPTKYGLLDEQALRNGLSLSEFAAAWRAFLRDDDVLCAWGQYAIGLFEKEGFVLPARRIDLRKVCGDFLKRRPGSTEALMETLELTSQPEGMGRAGERLGRLLALTRMLQARAAPVQPL